jgi:hypothetical protein
MTPSLIAPAGNAVQLAPESSEYFNTSPEPSDRPSSAIHVTVAFAVTQ